MKRRGRTGPVGCPRARTGTPARAEPQRPERHPLRASASFAVSRPVLHGTRRRRGNESYYPDGAINSFHPGNVRIRLGRVNRELTQIAGDRDSGRCRHALGRRPAIHTFAEITLQAEGGPDAQAATQARRCGAIGAG